MCNINCGFARVAIRELTPVEQCKFGVFIDKASRVKEFREHFDNTSYMRGFPSTFFTAGPKHPSLFDRKCNNLLSTFGKKWHPPTMRTEYLSVFSTQNWKKMDDHEKGKHTLSNCTECYQKYKSLQEAFPEKPIYIPEPGPTHQLIETTTELVKQQGSNTQGTTKKGLGSAIVSALDPICQEAVGATLSQVLQATPSAMLQAKPTPQQKKKQSREMMRKVQRKLKIQYNERDCDFILKNRIGWEKFNTIRLQQSFETFEQATSRVAKQGIKKRRHGALKENLDIDQAALLEEASTWPDDKKVNWSQLGERYGLTCLNRGQVIKEFLGENGIAAAKCQPPRVKRKKSKLPGGEISQPQHGTIKFQKSVLQKRIEEGEYCMGEAIVPTEYTVFRVDKESGKILQKKQTVYGRLIPLNDILCKLLLKHNELGVVRCSGTETKALSVAEMTGYLDRIGEVYPLGASKEILEALVVSHLTTRHIKVWHDHGVIAGHGHLLVTVSAIYDPAFFYTSQEMADKGVSIDVPTVVEQPEIHLLARSGSSDLEQSVFNSHRLSAIQALGEPVYMPNGTPVHDVLRFFHGDHPAQQFEAGNKKGGYYPCVMCEGRASRFDDLAYCYRCDTISLLDRQRFILAGTSWKDKSKPFQGLKLPEIRRELESRGIDTTGKLRNQLDESLDELRKGIAQFPALVQPNPQDTLDAINLQHYEIATVEPLHDFKGHMANLFDELPFLLTGNALMEVTKIKDSVLNNNTLRCVDYRKATILLSQALRTTEVSENVKMIADTAVEICEILYTREDRRSPRSILRLHNLTYLHGKLCSNAFHNPRSITKQKMFGQYYHSLTCHSATTYRLISLRSLNTEFQERTFGQANGITRQTSSNHPQHIIDNAILRIQAETSRTIQTISQQDGEVSRLASAWENLPNTLITTEFMQQNSLEFQSHLERISDFLLPGPGVWWRQTPSGIEFLDGPTEESARREGPMLQHFRSFRLSDLQQYLFQCWETCIDNQTSIPLVTVRKYTSEGDLQALINTSSTEPEANAEEQMSDEEVYQSEEVIDIQPTNTTHTHTNSNESVSEVTSNSHQSSSSAANIHTSHSTEITRYKMKTKLGKVLLDIVPDTDLVSSYDRTRAQLKAQKIVNLTHKPTIAKYENISQKIKLELLRVYKQAMREVNTFSASTTRETTYPEHIQHAKHKANICRRVLQSEWKETPTM